MKPRRPLGTNLGTKLGRDSGQIWDDIWHGRRDEIVCRTKRRDNIWDAFGTKFRRKSGTLFYVRRNDGTPFGTHLGRNLGRNSGASKLHHLSHGTRIFTIFVQASRCLDATKRCCRDAMRGRMAVTQLVHRMLRAFRRPLC